jgi:signal transduction histidine kinase
MKIFICLNIFFISFQAFSQRQGQALMDSLNQEISHTKEDTTKAKLYFQIADILIDIDLNKSSTYADSGFFIAKKINWKEGLAKSEITYGNIYNFKGDYYKAIPHIKQGYRLYKELGNKKEMGNAVYAAGMSYERLSDYIKASDCYFKSLKIFETVPDNDRSAGNSLSAIAVIYFLQKDFKKSLDYSFKALEKQESAKNSVGIANELTCMADTYHEMNDSANAVKYNLRALELFKKMGNKEGQAVVNTQLGIVNRRSSEIALGYLFSAKKLFEEMGDSTSINYNTCIGEIGRILLTMVKQDEPAQMSAVKFGLPSNKTGLLTMARTYLQSAVTASLETGDIADVAACSKDLAEAQAMEGDYKNAYNNIKNYQQLTDSIFSQDNKNKIAAMESQGAIDLKNREIENEKLQISNQHKKMWLLAIVIAFMATIAALIYYQSNTRKKNNTILLKLNNELDEANKIKAKFFGILSHDLRSPVSNLINFMQLQKRKPGILNETQMTDRENKITDSAKSLLETMEAMLLWSKSQMEHFKPEMTSVTVNSLFEYLQKFFAATTDVRFSFSGEAGLTVQTDENYLKCIMLNLTANAVKVLRQTPDAQVNWKAWQDHNVMHLSITDNGAGATEAQLSALYDATASSGAKNGLGLHIIRDLTRSIGCKIRLDQEIKPGTSFVLSIPVI